MEISLAAVIVVVASAVGICVAVWIVSLYRQRKLLRETRDWLPVEANIESGALEATTETSKVILPTFAFSYRVGEDYFSGRFALIPEKHFPSRDLVQSMIDRMIGRRLLLRYNPRHPELWFIPEGFIEGCNVEQRIGSHVIGRFYPRD